VPTQSSLDQLEVPSRKLGMASLSKELNRGGVPAPATKPRVEDRRGAGLFPAHPAPGGATGATGAGLEGGGPGRSAGHGKDREQLLNPAAAASLAGGLSARGGDDLLEFRSASLAPVFENRHHRPPDLNYIESRNRFQLRWRGVGTSGWGALAPAFFLCLLDVERLENGLTALRLFHRVTRCHHVTGPMNFISHERSNKWRKR